MVGMESGTEKPQVPTRVAELELGASLCWASGTEDRGFPRGTMLVAARVSDQSEWHVQGLICISP